MKCYYCDAQISGSVKYCPKCGLPTGEDVTIAGGLLPDMQDAQPWLWAGGAVGVLLLAVGIGWMVQQNSAPARTPAAIVRQPIAPSAAPLSAALPSGSTWGAPPASYGSLYSPPVAAPSYAPGASTPPPIPPPDSKKRKKRAPRVVQAPPPPLIPMLRGSSRPSSVVRVRSAIPPAPPKIQQYSLPYWFYNGSGNAGGAPNSGGTGQGIGGTPAIQFNPAFGLPAAAPQPPPDVENLPQEPAPSEPGVTAAPEG